VRREGLPWAMRGVAVAWVLASTTDNFVVFVLFWLAEPQGWSGVQTAFVVLATRLPCLVGGIFGGRAVDRFGPRRMLAADAGLRLFVMLGLVVAGADGDLGLSTVLVLGAIAGTFAPISYAAARTLTPRLVRSDQLGRANSLLGIGDQLPLLAAAGLAGPTLSTMGIGPAFLVPAVLLAVVLVIAMLLPERSSSDSAAVERIHLEAPAARPWQTAGVKPLVALSVAYYFTYGPFETVMPSFVRDDLDAGVGGYSLLWTVFGLASLASLSTAPWLARRRPGLVNAAGAALWGLVTIPFVLADTLLAAVIFFALSGAVWGPYSAIETTALQHRIHPQSHGRVFGTQRALLQSASPLGAAVGAVALGYASPMVILLVSAMGCTVAGLIALLSPGIRAEAATPLPQPGRDPRDHLASRL